MPKNELLVIPILPSYALVVIRSERAVPDSETSKCVHIEQKL
jgi:hypothetical protein